MSEAAEKKPKTEVEKIQMEDGREVGFAGNRKIDKTAVVNDSNIALDGDTVSLASGAVSVQIDLRNGKTVTCILPSALVAKAAAHGLSQKLGDQVAGEKDLDDAVIALEELSQRIQAGEWNVERESGGGFSGASIVIRAIMEATGKDLETVKAFLQKKLDDAKARGEELSRQKLYASFRNPNSKTGQIIKRMEEEKLVKGSAVDADAALEELGNAA